MDAVFNRALPWSGGHGHFNSDLETFYQDFRAHRVSSVNNRLLNLERLGDFRMTRFIRDPRDLVVSGYFYHRQGAEPWCTLPNPTKDDWYFANGVVPDGLRKAGGSYAMYLRSLSEEEGLLAELEFRQAHFASMSEWPDSDPRILLLRYEDVVADEVGSFRRMFVHYGLGALERRLGRFFASRYSAARLQRKDPHIRDPSSGQWRAHFTPRVRDAFESRWGKLIDQLGYAAD